MEVNIAFYEFRSNVRVEEDKRKRSALLKNRMTRNATVNITGKLTYQV